MNKHPTPRGGARPGAGAKAKDGATAVERVTVCLTSGQRARLRELGGSIWVRNQIDASQAEPIKRKPGRQP